MKSLRGALASNTDIAVLALRERNEWRQRISDALNLTDTDHGVQFATLDEVEHEIDYLRRLRDWRFQVATALGLVDHGRHGTLDECLAEIHRLRGGLHVDLDPTP